MQTPLFYGDPVVYITDVHLFDPENGETTKAFITEFKHNVPKEYKINFHDPVNSSEELPLVVVVRSTTGRFEDDFDAALMTTQESSLKRPDVIIYFHMKNYSETDLNTAELKMKYTRITVIDMDFTQQNLFNDKYFKMCRGLKDKNASAYEKLKRSIVRLPNANFENKMLVCDNAEIDTASTYMSGNMAQTKGTMDKAQNKLKLFVFFCSTEEDRLGDRVKKFVLGHLKEKNRYDIVVYDPAETEFQKAFDHNDKKTDECDDDIQSPDAFLLISCENNYSSIPQALSKMSKDFPVKSYGWRPSAIVTYSQNIFGGMEAAKQLQKMTGELGCSSDSNTFAIKNVHEVLNEDGTPSEDHLFKGIDGLMAQLDWIAEAFKDKKAKSGVPKDKE